MLRTHQSHNLHALPHNTTEPYQAQQVKNRCFITRTLTLQLNICVSDIKLKIDFWSGCPTGNINNKLIRDRKRCQKARISHRHKTHVSQFFLMGNIQSKSLHSASGIHIDGRLGRVFGEQYLHTCFVRQALKITQPCFWARHAISCSLSPRSVPWFSFRDLYTNVSDKTVLKEKGKEKSHPVVAPFETSFDL